MKKTPLTFFAIAALAAGGASAQEQSRTHSFDGPNVSATSTTTVNRESGTATRERSATNLNTGNTATSSAARQRTDTGATIDVVQTGPGGNSRTLSGDRVRTDTGSTFTGTATGRGGNSYGLEGERNRDGRGNRSANQSVTNSGGDTVFSRSRSRSVSDGQVTRNVSRDRASGFRPKRVGRPR